MICVVLLFFHFAAWFIKSFAKAWILTKWQRRKEGKSKALDDGTAKAEGVHTLVDVLIATFNLVAVVDDACAVGTEGGDEQGDTSADVGRAVRHRSHG